MRLRFRTKLLFAFLLLSLSLVGTALWFTQKAAQGAAREKITSDFRRTVSAFKKVVQARLRTFAQATSAALSDSLFRSQISKTADDDRDLGLGDVAPAKRGKRRVKTAPPKPPKQDPVSETHDIFASAELALFDQYPVLTIVNGNGILLYSKSLPQRFGDQLGAIGLVNRTLHEGHAVELWWGGDARLKMAGLLPGGEPDELYLVMGREISTNQGVVGAVIAGEPVSQSLLSEIAEISHARVALTNTKGQIATAGTGRDELVALITNQAAAALERDGDSREFKRQDDDTWLGLAAAIPGLTESDTLGRAYLFRSLREELGPFNRRMQLTLSIALGIAVLVSLAFAWFLSRRMTRPLRLLEASVRKVREGDLDVHVDVGTRDEMGDLAGAFNEMTQGLKQRDQIKATFKRYLAPAVVEELIKNPDRLNLGGQARELTILFSDLVGFTSLSEGRDARDLVALLNEYFDEVGQAIVARGGTLDKFAGDSVMCFFGAPLEQPDHRRRALLAGLDHLEAVDRIRERWVTQGRPPIDCRIGINTGVVVVGNIGSRDGQDYTVIGDPVNLASRLEGANKEYGTRFMVSEATLQGAQDVAEVRELDILKVKGKTQGVRVYEVMGRKGALPPERLQLRDTFATALTAYRTRQFSRAADGFRACLALDENDGPSKTLIGRCEHYLAHPPDPGWSGVWAMTTK